MADIFLKKDIKLKDTEKLAYIEGHRTFGICSNRTCDFNIKPFDTPKAYESQHIQPFYFSSSSSKWAVIISVPLLDFSSSFDKAVKVIFEVVTDEVVKVSQIFK